MGHRFSDSFLMLHSHSRCPSFSHVNICSRTPKVLLNNLIYPAFAHNRISRTWCVHLNRQLYFKLLLRHTLIRDFFVLIFCLPVCASCGAFQTHWSLPQKANKQTNKNLRTQLQTRSHRNEWESTVTVIHVSADNFHSCAGLSTHDLYQTPADCWRQSFP